MGRRREPPLAEAGATGLKEFHGRIQEEWLPQLTGSKAVQLYREMADNDASISAAMYLLEMLVRQVEWTVASPHSSSTAEAAAEFVESCRGDMTHTWTDFISEVMTMCVFGWSYFEINYKYRRGENENRFFRSKYSDGMVGWRSLAIRSQESLERWEFSDDGDILGMYQRPAPRYNLRYIPIEKALLFRTRSHKNNPEGRSLLRGAYKSYYYLKRIQSIEAIGVERDLAGLPVMTVPAEIMHPNASAAQKAIRTNMENMVQKIKRDAYEGVVLPAETSLDGTPTGYRLSLLSSGGRRPIDVDAIIKRYESRIMMSFLAEMLLLGQDSVGSWALADAKTNILSMSINALLDAVTDVINREAIAKLCQYNGIAEEDWPTLERGDMETPDLQQLGSFITATTGAGALVPDESLEQHLRQVAGLPTKDSEAPSVLELPDDMMGQFDFPGLGVPQSPADHQTDSETELPPVDPAAALNGAQVTAALDIVNQVAAGTLPRDAGLSQIQVFFNLTENQASEIMGTAGQGFMPEPEEN